jgi:tetratricopeptide (TPR) repeat protein
VPDYRFQLGLTYSQMGDAAAAIPVFQALVRDTPVTGADPLPDAGRNRRLFMLNLGFLYLEQRRPDNALDVFLQIRREYPDDSESLVHVQLVSILRGLKRYDESLAAAETGLKALPDNARILGEQAQTLAAAGRSDEAVRLLQDRLTADREDDIPLYLGLAAVHAEDKRWDDALHALETARSRHPEDVALMFQHAALLEQAGRYEPAADAFRKLLQADPDNATALNYLGYMLIDYDLDVTKGIGYVQEALALEPKNPAYLDSLGWGYYKRKEYRKALDFLLQAARALPTDPTIMEHLGDVYRALGRPHDARDCYEKALSFSPEADALARLQDKVKQLKPRLQK